MDTDHKDFDIRQYVWDYFQLHAEQRLKTFEFYIVIATVLLSGYAISLKEDNFMPLGIVLGILLIIISFVFWKLDVRNKQLIKNAEQALKTIENELIPESTGKTPHYLKLINCDDFNVQQRKNKPGFLLRYKYLSYSDCFNIMFIVFATLGIGAILWTGRCLIKHNGKSLDLDVKSESVLKDGDYTETKESISESLNKK